MHWRDLLRRRAEQLGLTYREVADRADLDPSEVHRYFGGKRDGLSGEKVLEIAAALGFSLVLSRKLARKKIPKNRKKSIANPQ